MQADKQVDKNVFPAYIKPFLLNLPLKVASLKHGNQ